MTFPTINHSLLLNLTEKENDLIDQGCNYDRIFVLESGGIGFIPEKIFGGMTSSFSSFNEEYTIKRGKRCHQFNHWFSVFDDVWGVSWAAYYPMQAKEGEKITVAFGHDSPKFFTCWLHGLNGLVLVKFYPWLALQLLESRKHILLEPWFSNKALCTEQEYRKLKVKLRLCLQTYPETIDSLTDGEGYQLSR